MGRDTGSTNTPAASALDRVGTGRFPVGTSSKREKVLIADDNRLVRETVALTLGREDFSILHAETGGRAVELARAHQPDLVLLDIAMPEMNGIEVCRVLKADQRTMGIRIIMLTASWSPDIRMKALEAGADDYFVKPFSPLSLLDKVHEVLRG